MRGWILWRTCKETEGQIATGSSSLSSSMIKRDICLIKSARNKSSSNSIAKSIASTYPETAALSVAS